MRADELSPDVQARIDANPLRAFDSADAGTQAVMRDAPELIDRLAPEDAEHFEEVQRLLDEVEIAYEVDPALVRGLDYYTRTVFEFTSDALGAQSGVGGGGRYDGLVEQLGGPPTPGVGWAAGVERILLAAGSARTWSGGLHRLFRRRSEAGTPATSRFGFARKRRKTIPVRARRRRVVR